MAPCEVWTPRRATLTLVTPANGEEGGKVWALFAQIKSGWPTHPSYFPQFFTTSTSGGIHRINPAPLPHPFRSARPFAHNFFSWDCLTTDRPEVLAVAPSVGPALATPPLLLSELGPCLVGGAVRLRSTTHSFAPKIAVHRRSVAFVTTDCVTFPGTDWPLPNLSSDDVTRWIACTRSVPPSLCLIEHNSFLVPGVIYGESSPLQSTTTPSSK